MADEIISSTQNPKAKRIRSLAMKKYRDADKVFIVEGLGHVESALAHGWEIETLVFATDAKKNAAAVIDACRKAKKPFVHEVTPAVLSHMTNRDNAQSVIGVFYQKFSDVADVASSNPGLWLGLENVRDPGNLGTIIRTADAVGVAGMMLIGNTCDPFSPEVIRATTGSFAAVKLMQLSLDDFLKWRGSFKGKVIGTHLHKDAVDYREAKVNDMPALLLMGGEQSGLSDAVAGACDHFLKIPMRKGVESLNLAVSTAILLYQLAVPPVSLP